MASLLLAAALAGGLLGRGATGAPANRSVRPGRLISLSGRFQASRPTNTVRGEASECKKSFTVRGRQDGHKPQRPSIWLRARFCGPRVARNGPHPASLEDSCLEQEAL